MYEKTILMLFVGVSFSLISACGEGEKSASPGSDSIPVVAKSEGDGKLNGEEIYKKTCIACHQANGEGIANAFPPLAKSDFLANKVEVIEQVIYGKTGEMTVNGVKYNGVMPPQALTDDEIASVLTYVYSSWGNTGGPVTSSEVSAIRLKKI